MSRYTLLFLSFFGALFSKAQNPATVIQLPQKNIVLPCGAACTNITATIPHIKQSDDYTVQTIPFSPFSYTGGTELVSLYADDIYSSVITLPFPVCFYGSNYNSLVVGSNGIVSFDASNAGKRNNFRQTVSFSNLTPVGIPYSGGTQNTLASTYYPRAAVMGVYHDIFPLDNGLRRIEWRMEGTAPKRRFIASYKDVAMFSCTALSATHQIVVYESTGVVEVYVKDKPVCAAWNAGLAILGMQNFARNKAIVPAGKNAGQWGTMDMNEGYRFTPTAGSSKFKKAELIYNGSVVALADTSSTPNGELNLSFANFCPAEDSVQLTMRVTYNSCTVAGEEVSFEDTLTVRKESLQVSLQSTQPTCLTRGSIQVNATGLTGPVTFSLNGGAGQTSNLFTNLLPGSYTVVAQGGLSCVVTAAADLILQNDLTLTAAPSVTVCKGDVFTPQVSSNGNSFSWTPVTGIADATQMTTQFVATQSGLYTVKATRGSCEQTATLQVNVKALPNVNAGADKTIVEGDVVMLEAFASGSDVNWTPPTALNNNKILQPLASPATTTTYELTATENGCSATDAVTITVAPYCIKPMEAFTPNGDGINDVWLITNGNCLQTAKAEVFNRYGAKVFHSNNYTNNWNGLYEGKPLPDGTYYFIVTYQLLNGKTVYQKGNVTILR